MRRSAKAASLIRDHNRRRSDKVPDTSDALLSDADQEEALSRVYARAVAARAGYTTADRDFDRDSVDLSINAGGAMRPGIDLQLKATTNLRRLRDGSIRYDLKVHNYDLLRIQTQTPRILMVLELPPNKDHWMDVSDLRLILRKSAFWVNLLGADEVPNRSTVAIDVPDGNLFNVGGLRTLMEQSRSGQIR